MSETQRVQVLLDPELVKRLDAKSKVQNTNRSELIRLACEAYLSEGAANEGVDATMRLLRKVVQDEMNPQINRLAKMIAKTTKASATGMYMQVVALDTNPELDAKEIFRNSETKAVGYLNTRE